MATDKSVQDPQAVQASLAKDSGKRAPEVTGLVNQSKTKLYRDENGNAQSSSHVGKESKDDEAEFGEGEMEIALVDTKSGNAIDLNSLSGIELFGLIKEEIIKLTSHIDSTSANPSCHNFQLSSLITEDEKSALIKLFEAAQDKFTTESHDTDEAIRSPMWISCYVMTKLFFGQFLNLKEPVVDARAFIISSSDKFPTSDPSPLILLSLVHLNEILFSLKGHYDDIYPNNVKDDNNENASTVSLPSEACDSLKEAGTSINKVFVAFKDTQLSEADLGVSQRLFIEWVETISAVILFNKFISEEKDFVLSALNTLNMALEKLATPLLLKSSSSSLSSINTLLFRIFGALGSIFSLPIKSMLLMADRISQKFLDANEGDFEHFSSFGHMSLALSKLVRDCTSASQEDSTEASAEFYAKALECFETALQFKKDVYLESYLNDLTNGSGNEGPSYLALLNNDAMEDDDEDSAFVPSENEENDDEIVVNPAEEDLSDGVEDADVPLDQIPEVTMEPGQVLLEGTRSAKPSALAEDEDEEADPEFVPQVTDVEEELGQSDNEEESGLIENDSAVVDEPIEREPTESIPSVILAHSEPLVEENEEVDPEFVPLHKEVEEDLAPSDDEQKVEPAVQEDDSEDDASFVPSDEGSEDESDDLDEEDEEADI